ncbi:hypothetical protein FACS189416_0170 [Bacteroidia bacterium]|nr:hypothetical protein FACS189416_0170 [Bacteroidia bacterium]
MEISGKIIAVLPALGGTSRTGNEWKKQEYVLETHEQYPKKVCFQLFGIDKIEQAGIQMGEELTVSIDIDSHEYNGKWFTNINAWKVERTGGAPVNPIIPQSAAVSFTSEAPNFPPPGPADDLPF